MAKPAKHVFVCTQNRPQGHPRGSCMHSGAAAVWDQFAAEFQRRNLYAQFALTSTGCLGACSGPQVLIYPEAVMYGKVTKDDVSTIIDEHLLADKPVSRLQVPPEVWS